MKRKINLPKGKEYHWKHTLFLCDKKQRKTILPLTKVKYKWFSLLTFPHSYYLQYKTKRPDYINAFWNIVNWNEVNKRFSSI